MSNTLLVFRSGHIVPFPQCGIIEPSFKARFSLNLVVKAGPDLPDADEPVVDIETALDVRVAWKMYLPGSAEDHIEVGNTSYRKGESSPLIDSRVFTTLSDAELQQDLFTSVRNLTGYHTSWRRIVADGNPLPNALLSDDSSAASPEVYVHRIKNRTEKLRQKMRDNKLIGVKVLGADIEKLEDLEQILIDSGFEMTDEMRSAITMPPIASTFEIGDDVFPEGGFGSSKDYGDAEKDPSEDSDDDSPQGDDDDI